MSSLDLPQRTDDGSASLQGALLESLATAVLVLDGQLCIQYANHAAEQLLATSWAHLRQQAFTAFLDGADWNAARLRQGLLTQQPYIQRGVRLRGGGDAPLATVDYSVTPLAQVAGEGGQLLIELHPLDRLMHINREDNRFTTNQATRALVRGMAHEIKNPLGGIRGAAQLLERQLGQSALREYTDVIIHESDRLRKLVDRMLDARQPPDFKSLNIHQLLERVRLIVQAEVGTALTLVRDYDPSLPQVWGDADQLVQVFLNVLRNAAQALLEMPGAAGQAPRLCITLRTRVLHQVTIGARRHPLMCLVEVQDNGPGIGEELRETLFYPMVTGRPQGTGLGLPIAQSIMLQHGGLIECDSRPGQTIFKILVPFHPSATNFDTGVPTDGQA